MSVSHAPNARLAIAERYADWIDAHLVRLAQGHDPMGHLFAIERLARASRAEAWAALRQNAHERHGTSTA